MLLDTNIRRDRHEIKNHYFRLTEALDSGAPMTGSIALKVLRYFPLNHR